ncbi:MAG: TolC family protein, partial [Zetaproteobacteria bacterium]
MAGRQEAVMRAFWVVLFVWAAAAEAAEPLSLAEAVRLALAHAPEMRAKALDREAAIKQARVALASVLPIVRARLSAMRTDQRYRFDVPRPFLTPRVKATQTAAELEIVQPLVRLDRWAVKREGEIGKTLAELAFTWAREQLISEVVARWGKARAAEEALRAAEKRLKAAQTAARAAEVRYQTGAGTKPELLLARARQKEAEAAAFAAREQWRLARARLESLIGRKVEALGAADLPIRLPEGWVERARTDALSARIAHQKEALAEASVQEALGQALPGLD